MRIDFIGGQAEGKSAKVNIQRTVNLYPEVTQGGLSPVVLYSTPGLRPEVSVGAGPGRSNGVRFLGKAYFVSGSELVSIDSSGVGISVGSLLTNTSRVTIETGYNDYIVLVDGTNGYTYDGTTFAQITDVDFPDNCTHITYHKNRWFANDSETGLFYMSDDGDPTSWSATNFASAESYPDNISSLISTDDYIWLGGEFTFEAFFNDGSANNFPYARVEGGYIEKGVHAPYSLVRNENTLYFLGQSKNGGFSVMKAQGSQSTNISTPELDSEFSKLAKLSDAYGFYYEDRGHGFYVLTFPSGGRTWVYDSTMPLDLAWTERTSYESLTFTRWRAAGHVFFNNDHYIIDYNSSNVFILDHSIGTDNGMLTERVRVAKFIANDGIRLTMGNIEIEFDSGTALLGDDPQAMLRFTDNGRLWSDELFESIGTTGNYNHRVRWSKLGGFYERAVEVKITSESPITITGAYGNVV